MPVSVIVARSLWLLCIVVAGCASETQPSVMPPSVASAAARTAIPEVSGDEAPTALELEEVLPLELGGVQLHAFAVGQDIVARLAGELGIGADDIEVRNASEHGARFLQMYALRAPGFGGLQLIEAWSAVTYPPDVTDGTVRQESIGDKVVTVVSAPSADARLGTFYAYGSGDTLLVVQAFDPAVASEALAALP